MGIRVAFGGWVDLLLGRVRMESWKSGSAERATARW